MRQTGGEQVGHEPWPCFRQPHPLHALGSALRVGHQDEHRVHGLQSILCRYPRRSGHAERLPFEPPSCCGMCHFLFRGHNNVLAAARTRRTRVSRRWQHRRRADEKGNWLHRRGACRIGVVFGLEAERGCRPAEGHRPGSRKVHRRPDGRWRPQADDSGHRKDLEAARDEHRKGLHPVRRTGLADVRAHRYPRAELPPNVARHDAHVLPHYPLRSVRGGVHRARCKTL
mmetsp:Transcript_30177/g.82975  ORF Transcript_30177/g.82975 Transcript_30177/m.82975 type:complete len:228 (+) Transcript_30177:1550-2233(+)